MQTVESILKDIYGSEAEATQLLIDRGLIKVRSAVSNWKASGFFPTRLLPQIMADASEKGLELAIADIPVMPLKRDTAAA